MHAEAKQPREHIACPLCGQAQATPWATENTYQAVKCATCGLVFVNPRPALHAIDEAVRAGAHTEESINLDVTARRVPGNVARYRKVIGQLFADVWREGRPISWLDIGAGYGEVVEAVTQIAPSGSRIAGIEPMKPKAQWARAHGLAVQEGYLKDVVGEFGFVSLMNVFSHIPDFKSFLQDVRRIMPPRGEMLIETGNIADIGERKNFPGELTLPDHLVFAGEVHIRRFLSEAGFETLDVRRYRIDGPSRFVKNIVKRAMGRPVSVQLPYTSPARTLLFRARLMA